MASDIVGGRSALDASSGNRSRFRNDDEHRRHRALRCHRAISARSSTLSTIETSNENLSTLREIFTLREPPGLTI
jgi:hypothetical protein